MILKRLVPWLPYIVVIIGLYPLGKSFFHVRHTIIFLAAVMPLVALAFTFSIRFLLGENDTDTTA